MGFRRIELIFTDLNDLLNSLNSCKPESVHFVTCPKQGREMEAVVLHRVGFLAYPCPKQGQDFKPSAAPLYPNMGQVSPRDSWVPITWCLTLHLPHSLSTRGEDVS